MNDLTWPHAKSALLPLSVLGACFGIGLALVSEPTKWLFMAFGSAPKCREEGLSFQSFLLLRSPW